MKKLKRKKQEEQERLEDEILDETAETEMELEDMEV